jgi:hypothetical protein
LDGDFGGCDVNEGNQQQSEQEAVAAANVWPSAHVADATRCVLKKYNWVGLDFRISAPKTRCTKTAVGSNL